MVTAASNNKDADLAAISSLFVVSSGNAAESAKDDMSLVKEETLLLALKVFDGPPTEDGVRAKERFICLTVKKNKIKLHKVKVTSGGVAQVGKTWALDDIKSVESFDPHHFQIVLNKPYHWSVEMPKKKVEFLSKLVGLCAKYLKGKQPKFIGVDAEKLKEELQTYENRERLRHGQFDAADDNENQGDAISPLEAALLYLQQEQDDLNIDEVLMDYQWKVEGDASQLEDRLMNELAALESANVHAIIQADEQSSKVAELIDKSIFELDVIDEWLSLYNNELSVMGKDIQEIESQNKGLQVETTNQKALLALLQNFIELLDLPDTIIDQLKFESLDDSFGIKRLEDACGKLQKALHTKIEVKIGAYSERMIQFGELSSQFAARFIDFLQKLVQSQVESILKRSSIVPGRRNSLEIANHEEFEETLFQYRSLIAWLQEMEARKFTELQMTYVTFAGELFKKEVRDVIDNVRLFWVAKKPSHEEPDYVFGTAPKSSILGSLAPGAQYGGKAMSVTNMIKGHRKTPSGQSDAGSISDGRSVNDDFKPSKPSGLRNRIVEASTFSLDQGPSDEQVIPASEAFQDLCKAMIPVMLRQQNFMSELFLFPGSAPTSTAIPKLILNLEQPRLTPMDLKVSKRIEELMNTLFDGTGGALNALVDHALRLDMTFSFAFLVHIEQVLASLTGTTNNFIVSLMTTLSKRLAAMWERFVDDQIRFIEETKVGVKKRTGLLPFIRVFPRFVARMESFLRDTTDGEVLSESRKMLSLSYDRIIKVIFTNLDLCVQEAQAVNSGGSVEKGEKSDEKEQLNAHIMALENMHHFYTELRGQKVSSLDVFVKNAKSRYEVHLSAYIRSVVRRSLSKLLEFFEGIDVLLKTKTPEEVGYHLNYNRASLKKIIAAYPGKEVKKILDTLYKRVDKHYSEEEGLLQVIWHGIQDEFIRSHQHFEGLIRKCYPESDMRLAFSIQDLCNFFSDIAKTH